MLKALKLILIIRKFTEMGPKIYFLFFKVISEIYVRIFQNTSLNLNLIAKCSENLVLNETHLNAHFPHVPANANNVPIFKLYNMQQQFYLNPKNT